jgi:hypothetical protein
MLSDGAFISAVIFPPFPPPMHSFPMRSLKTCCPGIVYLKTTPLWDSVHCNCTQDGAGRTPSANNHHLS